MSELLGENLTFNEGWTDSLPEEIRGESSLVSIKDLPSLAKSYVHAQKMIGADKIALPGKDATDDDWTKVYERLGRPESPDKYEFKRPENWPKELAYDEESEKAFRTWAHEAGLSARQAQRLLDRYNARTLETITGLTKQQDEARTQAESELKKEWGNAYQAKLDKANAAVRAFVSEADKEAMDKMGLLNNPAMVRLFSNIGESISDDKLKGDEGTSYTPADAQKEINAILGDKTNPYWVTGHPQHKDAVQKMALLYESAYPAEKKS